MNVNGTQVDIFTTMTINIFHFFVSFYIFFLAALRNHLQTQKRDTKSFDTGTLQSRCQIDEMDSIVADSRFMAAAAIHQSCDDGIFNDKNKLGADSNQRVDDASDAGRSDDVAKNNDAEQENEVRMNGKCL